jgi:LysR family carnitine catabolism transcriptional activator
MVVAGTLDMCVGCFSQPVTGVRRTPIYRFSLMLVEPAAHAGEVPQPMPWSEIGERPLLAQPAEHPVQQVIDLHLQGIGRRAAPEMVFNFFETQIAMVEAGAGRAVLPTFAVPACLERRVAMHPLTGPVVPIEIYQLVNRGKKLPLAAEAFTRFLRSYIAEWAEPWNPGC